MECGQVQNLLDLLASAIVKDSDGNASLNIELLMAQCSDLDPYITCSNNHIPPESHLTNIIGEDDCGRPTIRLTFPLIEQEDDEDLNLKSLQVGDETNYLHVDDTGHITFAGDARPWKDELGDALSIKVQGAGISTDLAENVVNFDFNAAYNANPSLADFLYKNVQLNHDKDLSVAIYPHIHWFQKKDYSPNFLFQYRWQINGGQQTTAWTFLKCNNLAFPYTGNPMHQISFSAPILAPVGSNLSDIIQFRIYRDTTNASGEFVGVTDPYNTGGNASAGVLSFDLHFQTNSLGSTDELIK